jgi:hypothetical protein
MQGQEQEEKDMEKLENPSESIIDEDLPMFSSLDIEAFDESKIPLPMFTVTVIFVFSLSVTFFMYYAAFFGFPDATGS